MIARLAAALALALLAVPASADTLVVNFTVVP